MPATRSCSGDIYCCRPEERSCGHCHTRPECDPCVCPHPLEPLCCAGGMHSAEGAARKPLLTVVRRCRSRHAEASTNKPVRACGRKEADGEHQNLCGAGVRTPGNENHHWTNMHPKQAVQLAPAPNKQRKAKTHLQIHIWTWTEDQVRRAVRTGMRPAFVTAAQVSSGWH